jgi:P pilus assembly chaperone PapD
MFRATRWLGLCLVLFPQFLMAQTPAAPKPDIAGTAVGDLLVAPTRIVFENRKRSEEITLVNVGTKAALYRIGFIQVQMEEDGVFRELPADAQVPNPADKLVRFSPRQVLLEPNVAQTIRIQLRKPADLAAGEYRSHLVFRAVPEAEPVKPPEATKPSDQSFQIKITPIYGVSIPVIVRHGNVSSQPSLVEARLERGDKDVVAFYIKRSGNASCYGDVVAHYLPPIAGSKEEEVGRANGVAVYANVARRLARLTLKPRANGQPMKGGRIRLMLRQSDTEQVLAEMMIEVP